MDEMRQGVVIVLAVAMAAGAPMSGQAQGAPRTARNAERSQQAAKLVSVHLVGSNRYNDDDLAIATGLKIGDAATPQDFKAAADKLVASGVFEEVRYQYQPAGTGYAVQFTVSDVPQFLPVLFDNFVWYTEKQLIDVVRQRVPLFKGELPTAGDMVDQVTDALQADLDTRGVPGQVRFLPESNLSGDVERGVFTIEGIKVRIASVKFTGADSDRSMLDAEAHKLINTSYQLSIVRRFAEFNLRPLYLARGYLKVTFGEPVTELLQNDAREPAVTVSIGVNPGTQYRMGNLVWSGNKAFSAEELNNAMKQKPGMVLDAIEFVKDIEQIQQLYGSKGYLRAKVSPHESFDDAQRTVAYSMNVQEGSQYRLGSVDLDGLDKLTMARLREAWKLREGEPFDTGYERVYMKLIGPTLAPNVSVSVSHEMNDESKTVDVTMKFIVHADKVIR
jgi:outer membrane protein assembly factor BamA